MIFRHFMCCCCTGSVRSARCSCHLRELTLPRLTEDARRLYSYNDFLDLRAPAHGDTFRKQGLEMVHRHARPNTLKSCLDVVTSMRTIVRPGPNWASGKVASISASQHGLTATTQRGVSKAPLVIMTQERIL